MNFGFDKYSFQARLRPALLSLFPVYATAVAWGPAVYGKVVIGLLGAAATCGLAVVFAHFVRTRGLAVQTRLVEKWGGMPTTLWLRHADLNLETETKSRYHQFLQRNVPDWTPPTTSEEMTDPAEADKQYRSAVDWLRAYTRDTNKFPLVLAENISYGFRRNVLGLKPVAIILATASTIFPIVQLYDVPIDIVVSDRFVELAVACVLFLTLLWWIIFVTDSWVRQAGDAYARALLSACDAPRK